MYVYCVITHYTLHILHTTQYTLNFKTTTGDNVTYPHQPPPLISLRGVKRDSLLTVLACVFFELLNTVPFVLNISPLRILSSAKQGGGCLTRGKKNSHFSQIRDFFGVIDEILVLKQGGVYHVIIGISDFGPKQGGVWYERNGLDVFS